MSKPFCIIFLFVFIQELALSQNLYVSNYTQQEYGSIEYTTSPQNWDIEQDSLGRLYLANSSGILLFDGLTWSMIPGTQNKDLHSISRSSDNIIYAGGRNELGFFKSDSLGKVIFKSLAPMIAKEDFEPGIISNVCTLGKTIYFKNKNGLIQLKDNSFTFYPILSKNRSLEIVEESIVVQDKFGHLLSFKNNQFDTLLSSGNKINPDLISLIKTSNDQLFLFTAESGIFSISHDKLIKWKTNIDKLLISDQIKNVAHYPELKLFGIATKSNGILFITYEGKLIKSLGTSQGLNSNTCYNLFQDKNNELWACFDNGLARIEYPSALSYFDFTNGLYGVLQSVIEEKDILYAGTTNGLYYLDDDNQFQKMSLTGVVWDLKRIDDTIWAVSNSGLYQIINHNIQLVADINARTIEPSGLKDRLWVGLFDGIGSIAKINGSWIWQHKIKEIDHEVRTIAVESDSVLWVSFEKVSRLVFSSGLSEIVKSETMTEEHGFTEDFYFTESYTLRNQTYFGTAVGLFSYDLNENRFVIDDSFGPRFADSKHEAFAMAEDADHNIWLTSNRVNGKLVFENDQVRSWDTLAFARLKSTDVWRIVPLKDKQLIYFCTTDGLFRYDQTIHKSYDINYTTLINKIAVNRDSVISYLEIDNAQKIDLFPFNLNDLHFSFSATSYNYDEKIQFSQVLVGYDEDWSSWDTKSTKDYTNLPHGDYIFKVKAKNLYGVQAEPAQYVFTIEPAWYNTYWSYGISFLLFASCLFIADRIQRKRLFKKQQARIKIQQIELERERQISNKLRKVDKLKDEFLANTSHELRTPLNGIIGISESLYEESQHIDEREIKNNLAMVIASGKRLASMVDSILDYSKLKTENLDINKKSVDLKSIVKIVLTMSRPLISEQDLSLIDEVPENLPLLEADENRLQQILYNLVGNAIKFTEIGKITVGARREEKFVEIEVRDEGVGIPEDKLDKIFDSYEQVNPEMDRDYIGTGLGLTISKKLVELHGGTIRVESKLKEGSSFKFTIPISLHQSSPWINTPIIQMEDSHLPPSIPSIKIIGQFNILIVDDEPINRHVLANHLKKEPYNLEMASNGFEALELLENNKFDLVLLDIMMPKISGFEVCMKIREKYMLSELPVIFITAKDQVIDLVEGLKYGGNDYITKPFSKQEFLARVKTHLNLFKINDSYSRFIPFEILQSLGRESILDVNLGDQIEKEVTILFSDIRDYTTLSEGMTPKENFNFLNSFLSKMGPVIRDNNGFIVQYLGDGLMSIFLHNPLDAIKASITMLTQIETYNIDRLNKSRKAIAVGFGLHTGKLVMGVIGDEKRMDVNVVSDSVNTASRMEGLTKLYGASIIMSEHTLIGMNGDNSVHHRFLGLVKVKGKTKPLKIYEILDGLSSKHNQIKIETKEAFEAGLRHYFNKEFIHAATEFKKVTTLNKRDVSAQMYLKLSAKYMVEGVPEHWNGEETMLLK